MTLALRLGLAAIAIAVLAVGIGMLAIAGLGGPALSGAPLWAVPLVVTLALAGLLHSTIQLNRDLRRASLSSDPDGGPASTDDSVRRSMRDTAVCGATVLVSPLLLVLVAALA